MLLDPLGNSVKWDLVDSSTSLSSELQDCHFSTRNDSLSILFQNDIPKYEISPYLAFSGIILKPPSQGNTETMLIKSLAGSLAFKSLVQDTACSLGMTTGTSALILSGGVLIASSATLPLSAVVTSSYNWRSEPVKSFTREKKERLMKGIGVPHLSWLKDTPAQGLACISMHKTLQAPGNCIMPRIILFYFQHLENTDLVYQF